MQDLSVIRSPQDICFQELPHRSLKARMYTCTLTLCTTSIYLCDLALLVGNLWVVFDGHCIGRPVFVYKSRISLYAPTIATYNPMIARIIIIKQPASRRALREVNRCCAAQFVHTSWPNSRQKAKLYPANNQTTKLQTTKIPHLLLSSIIWKNAPNAFSFLHIDIEVHNSRLAWIDDLRRLR